MCAFQVVLESSLDNDLEDVQARKSVLVVMRNSRKK